MSKFTKEMIADYADKLLIGLTEEENKTLLVSGIICSIVIVVISILFFVYELDNTMSVGFLVLLPFSWWLGYYIPKKENDKKIKELEKMK